MKPNNLLAIVAAGCLSAAVLPAMAADPAPPPPPAPPAGPDESDIERRLEAARERLDAAAREVAELSMRQGGGPGPRAYAFSTDGPRRAILGVQLGEGARGGANVVGVSPGGAADAAGLKAGDVIIAIDGVDLRKSDNPGRDLARQMRTVQPDQKVRLKVDRGGKQQNFEVMARAAPAGGMARMRPGPGAAPALPGIMDLEGMPPLVDFVMNRGPQGLELTTLTPKLGQYFGVDKGVLVLKVPPNNKLKLEEGDVLLSIDGREPASSSHALRILRSYQPGETVKLRVQRQRKAINVDGEVTEAPRARMEHAAPPPRIEKRVVIHRGGQEAT